MGDKILKSVFLSLMILMSLSVGISSLNAPDYTHTNLDSNSQPQLSSSHIEVTNISNSDCESTDHSTEVGYYACKLIHPNAGSFYAVFDGNQMNYFSKAGFGSRGLENHAITQDDGGNIHLAYISKKWVTYGSDPLGAGYEVQNVNYAYFNGTNW